MSGFETPAMAGLSAVGVEEPKHVALASMPDEQVCVFVWVFVWMCAWMCAWMCVILCARTGARTGVNASVRM